MAFERAFFDIQFSADLDGVPGMFNNKEDFITFLNQTLKQSIAHYKPEVKVISSKVVPYFYDEDKKEMVLETDRRPKVGDKTYSLEDGGGSITAIDGGMAVVSFTLSGEEYDNIDVPMSEFEYNKADGYWLYGDKEDK